MWAALEGPHGWASIITWAVAGIAGAVALVQLVRPGPPRRRWSRAAAVGLPLAVTGLLLVGSVAPALHGTAFDVAMVLRMTGYWAAVALVPLAVGQVVRLRPPRWLTRTFLVLAAVFLTLLLTTDLAFVTTDGYDPWVQFGPLAVPLLFPAAALAGWWLWMCLQRIGHSASRWLFAAGAAVTTLALTSAGLVLEPVLADHLLVVGLLPLLGVTQIVDGQRAWRQRRRPVAAARLSSPAQ